MPQDSQTKTDPPASLHPDCSPLNTAITGLMRDRSAIIEKRNGMNAMWCRYEEMWARYTSEIAAIDDRVDKLLSAHSANRYSAAVCGIANLTWDQGTGS